MKLINIVIAAMLIALMASGVAAFSMPSLLGKPMVPSIMQQSAAGTSSPLMPSASSMPTPGDVRSQSGETFTLTLSGNVYVDKVPVQGAIVSVYLNGRYAGKASSGDLYQFSVPGVRNGDTIRVDATYGGHTGTASETVKFKSMYLDVDVKSGKSFIRNALEMMTSGDNAGSKQSQPQATATATPQQAASTANTPTTSSTDTKALTSQVMGDTSKALLNTFGRNNAMLTGPVSPNTADAGTNMQISSLADAMNVAGVEVPTIS